MENKETKLNRMFEGVVSYCDSEMTFLEGRVQTCESSARNLFKTLTKPSPSYDPRQDLKVRAIEDMRRDLDQLRQKAEQMCEQLQAALDDDQIGRASCRERV